MAASAITTESQTLPLDGDGSMIPAAVSSTAKKHPADLLPWLPCELTLEIPVQHFTVRSLLNLRNGNVIETACQHTSDLPLRVNGHLIGWTELEPMGNHLGVRITELA
jgi:flagellar motor switch/type III secretory pathway protein FliN